MVEGDGCHRVAAEHRKSLLNRRFVASSPNGKFQAGARAIVKAGGVLLRIEVHGKNLFYFFGKRGSTPSLVVHIHFGMAGAFAVYKSEEPETTANTRLRLTTVGGSPVLAAHLSAMTVEFGVPNVLYEPKAAKLGPDPLREDADPKRFVERCAGLKKPIGTVMMDQACLAGVGNIYRSETLYEAKIHPEQPANTLTKQELLSLWNIVTKQMQAGFKTGSIWGNKKGAAVYGLERSSCGGKVRQWEMGGRTVYSCETAQKLELNRLPAAQPQKLVRTGTSHLGKMTAAVVAEQRKRRTGEGMGVQHVALKDDRTRSAALRAVTAMKRSHMASVAAVAVRKLGARPSRGATAKAKAVARTKVTPPSSKAAAAKRKAATTARPGRAAPAKRLRVASAGA